MVDHQPGILDHVPGAGRYLTFTLRPGGEARAALAALFRFADGERIVIGVGLELVRALGATIPGLVAAPSYALPGAMVPSTPGDLWCWLRDSDRGAILHLSRRISALVAPGFEVHQSIDTFKHGVGLDLTGYEDGTENPKGEAALAAAIVSGAGPGLDGSSFVAVQQWTHDFSAFDALGSEAQDQAIGRRRFDNVEIADAPASAHVKRTAQESFTPEAFLFRRSMPWVAGDRGGLMFVAFGHSFDAFAAQLARMVGAEDGIVDALFTFSQPVTGCYFWCPPHRHGRLDATRLGL